MTEDFVTQLRLQLREAAMREERRRPVMRQVAQVGRRVPGPAPVAAALAVALLALVVALGALALRDEPAPTAPRLVGSYPVASGLSSLAPAFGAVWTADPIRGEVLRIDPATRRVRARIPVPGEARVAVGAGAVWALAGDLLYAGDQGPVWLLRIDPATNRVVARIPMRSPSGARFGPLDLQVDGDAVWVVGVAGALRIDPLRSVPDRFVPIAEPARGTVTDGDSVWLLTAGGRLRRLDAVTGRVASEVRVAAPADSRLFWGRDGTLTLIGANDIALLERANGRALWRTTLPGDIRYAIGDGDVLWVQVSHDSAGPDQLVRLDAGSGRRLAHVDLPEPGVTGIARVGKEVWVATPGGKIVVVRSVQVEG